MHWEFIVALVITIPVILFPAAFVWYLNLGSVFQHIRRAKQKTEVAGGEGAKAIAEAERHIAAAARAQPVKKEFVGAKR